jgi:hypothetical protein
VGQVELSTNHNSLTRIMEHLRRLDYRVRDPEQADSEAQPDVVVSLS